MNSTMFSHAIICTPLFLVAFASGAGAQLTARAVTRSGLTVWANQSSQMVPPNTDITAGSSISASSSNNGVASAYSQFTLATSARSIDVVLAERGSAAGGTSPFYAAAGVGPQLGGQHNIDVILANPTPMLVRLMVSVCTMGHNGTLTVPGNGVVTAPFFCMTPSVYTFNVAVGPTPTALVFSTSGYAVGARGGTSFSGRWELSLSTSTCDGTAYENPCGATLSSYGLLNTAGTWIEMIDSSLPTVAFLLVGTQRTRLPFGNCFLYTDFPVILPFNLTAPDRATVLVPQPPVPVQVTLQGWTFGPSGMRASNGLALQCM
jgi:hypothetical protein